MSLKLMVHDRLNQAVLRRLQELGLPRELMQIQQFRDRLFQQGWVMFVRDQDAAADVHLFEPAKVKARRGGRVRRMPK
jgi:hypothetical protein